MAQRREHLRVVWREDTQFAYWSLLNERMHVALNAHGVPDAFHKRGEPSSIARACKAARLNRRLVGFGHRRIVSLSWASDTPAFPDSLWCEIVPWVFDCWSPQFDQWEALLRRHRVRLAFFSARAAAEEMQRRIPHLSAHWLPEANDFVGLDHSVPLADRSVDVLEYGRSYDRVHHPIARGLAASARVHRHGPISMPELEKALGDSKVVICYPKSVTHPESAGGVETVTQRYFEAIGAGALAVGACPGELRDLLGFDPVVALCESDPGSHLLEILAAISEYQPHVDQATARMREVGGYDVRMRELLRQVERFDAVH